MSKENQGVFVKLLPYGGLVAIIMCPPLAETKTKLKEATLNKSA